jgi:hypothetical protein
MGTIRRLAPTWPVLVLLVLLAGCATPVPSATSAASRHVDPATERIKAELASAFGMSFEPAGPHHELGTAPDGVQLDLVGVPPEEVILSLPASDRSAAAETGLDYLPYLRDLLHGADPVWDWAAAMLACRRAVDRSCDGEESQGNLVARFPDNDPDYIILVVSRR